MPSSASSTVLDLVLLIRIPTKSRENPKLKQRKDSNNKPLNHFDHDLLPDHSIALITPTTESFSICIRRLIIL